MLSSLLLGALLTAGVPVRPYIQPRAKLPVMMVMPSLKARLALPLFDLSTSRQGGGSFSGGTVANATTFSSLTTFSAGGRFSNGTSAAPSISFTSATGMGFYLASGRIALANGGSDPIFFDTTNSNIAFGSAYRLAWANNTSATAAGADTSVERAAASVVRSGNGSGGTGWFQNWAGRSFLTADYTNATATFSNTALSHTLTNGRKYTFTLSIFLTESTAADGVKIDFNGGNATMTNFVAHCVLTNAVGVGVTQVAAVSAALATVVSATATTDASQHVYICSGAIEPSSTGTFIVRGGQVAHTTGTVTFKRGSFMQIEDMP